MPPVVIRKFVQITVQQLYMTVFKAVRRDLEKHCRSRMCFNKMTSDEDAFRYSKSKWHMKGRMRYMMTLNRQLR